MCEVNPLAVDLCCGLGGWTAGLLAEGWRVVGFDIVRPRSFPTRAKDGTRGALFVQQDVRTISGVLWGGVVSLIVASPPCTEFTQIWNFSPHRKPDPRKGIELVNACWRIAREAGCPFVLENVAGARKYIGPPTTHIGPYYLWGDPLILEPYGRFAKHAWTANRSDHDGKWRVKPCVHDQAVRSLVPIELARAVARQFYPSEHAPTA